MTLAEQTSSPAPGLTRDPAPTPAPSSPAPATASRDLAAGGIFGPALRTPTIGVIITITLFAFEAMAVATALPSAARDLDGLAIYGWAFTAFLIANVVGMVMSGGLCDRRGPRLPLVSGLAGFVAGLVIAGLAPTMPELIVGRAVQGLAGGALITALYVVVGQLYPRHLQPKVIAAMSSAWVVPSLVGPVIAGTLTEHLGWRSVFLGLLPVAVIGAVLLVPSLRQVVIVPRATASPMAGRFGRALAVAVGVATLQQAGAVRSVWAVAPAVVGLLVLGWALTGLLPAGAWRVAPGVAGPVVLRGLLAASFFGMEALIPLSLSEQHGLGPIAAGVPLSFSAVAWAAGSWIQGRERWNDRHRVRLARVGFGAISIAAVGVAVVTRPTTPEFFVFPVWALAGLGAGLGMSSVSVLLLRFTTDADRGRDSSSLQLSDAVGAALATGFGGIMVALSIRGVVSPGTAFAVLDLTMAAVALVGVLAAGRVRPAPTR